MSDMRVKAIFDRYPAKLRRQLLGLRSLIFEAAAQADDVGYLTETLRWGQPSYLPSRAGIGTTVRIDALRPPRSGSAVYFHCQTGLIESFRERYPGLFRIEDNRALLFAASDEVPRDELRHCVALALTYHRRKSKGV